MKRGLVALSILFFILAICTFASPSETQAQSAWAPNVAYSVNQLVTYNGSTYKCLQAHTSLPGWEPPNVASLWTLQSGGVPTNTPSGPTATRTNTPSGPTATRTNTPSAPTNTPSGSGCYTPYVHGNVYTADMTASYNGRNWRAKWWTQNEAPSTGGSGVWQDLGACGGGSSPTNTPAGPTNTPVPGSFVVSEAQFNAWFPSRNSLYTYANFLTARASYSGFASNADVNKNKIEAAAFFAHVAHETSYLVHTRELSPPAGWYCLSGAYGTCPSTKEYFGRGPLQLSWNYNYKMATDGKYWQNGSTWVTIMLPIVGEDIYNNPDLVATNGLVAWKTALWYWMNHGKDWDPAQPTVHDAIMNTGFGETIYKINGGLECLQTAQHPQGSTSPNTAQMNSRVSIYNTFLSNLGATDSRLKTC